LNQFNQGNLGFIIDLIVPLSGPGTPPPLASGLTRELFIRTSSNLTDSGGTFALAGEEDLVLLDNGGVLATLATRQTTGGELQATPEPATLVLLGTTLVGIGLRARWRLRKQS
jgi:hypothetical protein